MLIFISGPFPHQPVFTTFFYEVSKKKNKESFKLLRKKEQFSIYCT